MNVQTFDEGLLKASASMTATGRVLMQGKSEVRYEAEERTYHPMEAANPAYTFPKDANRPMRPRDDTPDHLSVSGMVNLLATEARQLLEEIIELRSRLSPILSEQKTPPQERRATAPVQCRMAAELSGVEDILKQAREAVYLTISQLDL